MVLQAAARRRKKHTRPQFRPCPGYRHKTRECTPPPHTHTRKGARLELHSHRKNGNHTPGDSTKQTQGGGGHTASTDKRPGMKKHGRQQQHHGQKGEAMGQVKHKGGGRRHPVSGCVGGIMFAPPTMSHRAYVTPHMVFCLPRLSTKKGRITQLHGFGRAQSGQARAGGE